MVRFPLLVAAALSLIVPADSPLRAQGNCPQCDLPPSCRGQGNRGPRANDRNCQTLEISIESDVDFGRLVLLGSGGARVLLDLETGERRLLGDIDEIGGMPITGRALITGAPRAPVRIDLPVEVSMRDPIGGEARIRDFVTDLPATPQLDGNGLLTFRFSGTLVIDADTRASGNLRGRVPISVEYP